MVFRGQNPFRKCKWCSKSVKQNFSSGINKGYYRTCGSEECLTAQYRCRNIGILKGRVKKIINCVCVICEKNFLRKSANHKRYCLECAPDHKWRGRCQRYGIGKPQWELLLEKQLYKCAICEKTPETVDHCHKTNRIRGLLCGGCNMGIGYMEKCNLRLKKSLKYLGVSYASLSFSEST